MHNSTTCSLTHYGCALVCIGIVKRLITTTLLFALGVKSAYVQKRISACAKPSSTVAIVASITLKTGSSAILARSG